ncbi:MAG: RtcB family protein [Polyangiaceae bacterium]|nr:RtcB family protein [Myxococcales bacterium]MCB9587544.1 RtcB family protein [Polyangiaceae bacterium]MCB9605659.1 RtcB family protein [Polyangiaceae bacterium]
MTPKTAKGGSGWEKVQAFLPEPLSQECRQNIGRIARRNDVARIALMPDVHLAEHVCVGAVVASRSHVYPQAVGGDIGCGVSAIRLQGELEALGAPEAQRVLQRLAETVPALKWPQPQALDALTGSCLSQPRLQRLLERDGALQLGTLGRGNHFVEFCSDEQQRPWLLVHSGSRGLGKAVRDHYCPKPLGPQLSAIEAMSDTGRAYLRDAELCVRYAELNRARIRAAATRAAMDLLGWQPEPETARDMVHNQVRYEAHSGEPLWVHRKGASSARQDELGIIPGSMGSHSYLVSGRGEPSSLCSSSHGAGRALSRTAAAIHISPQDLVAEMQGVFFEERRAAQLVSEAPSAYKPITQVMLRRRPWCASRPS